MTTVADLISGHGEYALWHGTRAELNGALTLGENVIGDAKGVIDTVWQVICESRRTSPDQLDSTDVEAYFLKPASRDRAVGIGNSIRFLRRDFNYACIAFAFDRFSANGYAHDGSELANAILALTESALLEYPAAFDNPALQASIQDAQRHARGLLSGKGKILKLIKMPAHGYFHAPGHPGEKVEVITHPVLPNRLLHTELFFSESIPLDHFEIVEI